MFDLPDESVQLAVFTDTYFDDRISAFHTDQQSRARWVFGIDWSDIAINILRTNSAKRVTNTADELYRFVMTPHIRHTMMQSKTFEVRVGDPNRHQVWGNFSDDQPNLTM